MVSKWLLESTVLPATKAFAVRHDLDLAIPGCGGSGLGNVLMYTRLVEEWARRHGRAATIVTRRLEPRSGVVPGERPFPFWDNNPYVASLVDADAVDPEGFQVVERERRDLVQMRHIITNICFAYGLRPRTLRPSLFLDVDEMARALEAVRGMRRPLICLHPGGTTRSAPGAPWHIENWLRLVAAFDSQAGFIQVGVPEFGDADLGLHRPARTIREMMGAIWASDLFIGFDSCPMHIATAFAMPVIALFDMFQKYEHELHFGPQYVPSVMSRWSYPQNTNIALMYNDEGAASFGVVIEAIQQQLNISANCN